MNIKHRWLSMADDKGIEAAFNKLLDEFASDIVLGGGLSIGIYAYVLTH